MILSKPALKKGKIWTIEDSVGFKRINISPVVQNQLEKTMGN